ncbi:hypothetical protein GCM10028820_31600 [Tessaracoccus terricola]
MILIAAISGALIAAGITAAIWAFQPQPEPAPTKHRRTRRISPGTRTIVLVGIAVGVLVAAVSGWLVAIVLVPAALITARRMIQRRTRPRVARLDALAEFARGIAGVLAVGRGIEQAILQASRSAPQTIEAEVGKLAARLRASWELKRALRAFADDFDDATADLFVATLLLASDRRGPGLAAVMQDMAASVDHEVRARREVETEQQKSHTAARMITIISAVLLAGLMVSGDYITPYNTPLGQLLLTAYLTGYAAILWWMSRMTKAKAIPRFIGTTPNGGNP